jgi:hypothetical protein
MRQSADWYRQTLEPYRDCPEGRAELSVNVWVGAVSIGMFELSR